MDLETRLTNLENLVHAFIKSAGIKADYANADTNAIRVTEGEHGEQINANASDIADNRAGIEETYESSLANAGDIADVRTALEEVYEMINEEG